ncbi:hypothetical protein LCI18_012568 [Fusarium solani-melongenae]|uniref:Uncharacterized protein n=1 Tax=Fusarium solani subsp. cucurbitae TaxID=2747967 RepID=A0ACD3ZJZ3_FUSSC|nr:hypothetical protein LCI18_012568 [Fusarium solani-melongenae]
MDSPIELSDGRLVCGRHGLPVCGSCCVDYTFMDDELPGSAGELDMLSYQGGSVVHDHDGPAPDYCRRVDPVTDCQPLPMREEGCIRGRGRVFPSQFAPPSPTSTPDGLFPPGTGRRTDPHVYRLIRRNNPDQFLIFTDGACSDNGRANPRAGWAFVFKPKTMYESGIVSARLENWGPFFHYYDQTNNRAELRAVLAALRFRYWPGDGFTTLVVATDSEYVAKGATEWAYGWVRNSWRNSRNEEVVNKDLWEALLGEIERLDEVGLKVEFWRILRSMNAVADRAAKQAAECEALNTFCDVLDVSV